MKRISTLSVIYVQQELKTALDFDRILPGIVFENQDPIPLNKVLVISLLQQVQSSHGGVLRALGCTAPSLLFRGGFKAE